MRKIKAKVCLDTEDIKCLYDKVKINWKICYIRDVSYIFLICSQTLPVNKIPWIRQQEEKEIHDIIWQSTCKRLTNCKWTFKIIFSVSNKMNTNKNNFCISTTIFELYNTRFCFSALRLIYENIFLFKGPGRSEESKEECVCVCVCVCEGWGALLETW